MDWELLFRFIELCNEARVAEEIDRAWEEHESKRRAQKQRQPRQRALRRRQERQ